MLNFWDFIGGIIALAFGLGCVVIFIAALVWAIGYLL